MIGSFGALSLNSKLVMRYLPWQWLECFFILLLFDLDPRLDNLGSELQPISTVDSDLGCSATVLRCFPIVKHCINNYNNGFLKAQDQSPLVFSIAFWSSKNASGVISLRFVRKSSRLIAFPTLPGPILIELLEVRLSLELMQVVLVSKVDHLIFIKMLTLE